MSVEDLKKELSVFFQNNSSSEVVEIGDNEQKKYAIRKPWGDESLELSVPVDQHNRSSLIEVLNSVVLPRRLSAVYHKDTRLLEILWTAYKTPPRLDDVLKRSFEFDLEGQVSKCYFGESSGRLMVIASNANPIATSETNYRNILSFNRHAMESATGAGQRLPGTPVSFFIEGLEAAEDKLVEFISNLNFYMTYYDISTPRVLVHEDPDVISSSTRVRFRTGDFPKHIDAKKVDENLLSFWNEAFNGNEILQFMLHFRIIEYASNSYSTEVLRKRIVKAVTRPDLRSRTTAVVDEIIEYLNGADGKIQDDYARFCNTVKESVSPELLWQEIEKDKGVFSSKQVCDGGFVLEPLIDKTATLENFKVKGVDSFARQVRDVRNVLSHGKDFPRDGVFRPTRKNLRLLRPWVTLLGLASGEIVMSRASR